MEDKRRAEIERGQQAQDLLEHPLLQAAFAAIEADFIAEWRELNAPTPNLTPEKRERIWLTLKMLDEVKRELKIHLERARVARDSHQSTATSDTSLDWIP
jgi:hypothetical protein